ncbi:MAG: DUF1330 domain-containing protein [Nitratireductor sp.]
MSRYMTPKRLKYVEERRSLQGIWRVTVRGGKEDRVEADDLGSRHVIEFENLEKGASLLQQRHLSGSPQAPPWCLEGQAGDRGRFRVMAKGYWIAHVDVHDRALQALCRGARQAFIDHGARFIARGGEHELLEGDIGGARHVIIEFRDLATARACWNSPVYQAAREHRLAASKGSVLIVEGAE